MPKFTPNANHSRFNQGPILPQFVHDYLAYGAQKGDRNDTLFKVAAQFLHAGIAEAYIAPQLIARAVVDGLSQFEAQKTITSAFNSEKKAPLGGNNIFTGGKYAGSCQNLGHSPGSTPLNGSHLNGSSHKRQYVPGPSSSRPFSMPIPPPIPDGFKRYLENNFKAGEGVSVSETIIENGNRRPGKGDLATREEWLEKIAIKPLEKYYAGGEGIFVRINPTTGSKIVDVTDFRHGLFEADKDSAGKLIPKEEQYAALINSHLPCRAILDSGDRSIHAVVHLGAGLNRAEYDRRYALCFEALEGHWIDDNNKDITRYSRVPGVPRRLYDENGNFIGNGRQELLALNVGEASFEEWEAKWTIDPFEEEIAQVLEVRKVSTLSQLKPLQLVDGILTRGTKLMFVAPSKSFKTWNLLNFFFCMANGIQYMNRRTLKNPIIYYDFELLEFDLWWRLSRIAAAYNLPGDPFANFFVVPLFGKLIGGRQINFRDSLVRKQMVSDIQAHCAASFAIDPIYMTYCGEDENSNSGTILSVFDPICHEADTTLVFNHHFTKGDQTGKFPFDRAAGGGIFQRNVYSAVAFTPHRIADAYTVNFTLRGSPTPSPFVVRWQLPFMVIDPSLDPEDLASPRIANSRAKANLTREKILAAIYGAEREGGLTTRQLEHVVGVDARTVQRHTKALIAKGEIMRSQLAPNPYQLSTSNAAAWLNVMP